MPRSVFPIKANQLPIAVNSQQQPVQHVQQELPRRPHPVWYVTRSAIRLQHWYNSHSFSVCFLAATTARPGIVPSLPNVPGVPNLAGLGGNPLGAITSGASLAKPLATGIVSETVSGITSGGGPLGK